MSFKMLECVVLVHDVAGYDLRTGDMGTLVEVYSGGGVEVEFVTGSGDTLALLTLDEKDVRRMDSRDLLATRRLAKARS